MKLYHGSKNKELEHFAFDFNSSSSFDFGKGVYFTSNFDKAMAWACNQNGSGAIYEIDLDLSSSGLKTKTFNKDDDDLYYLFYVCRIGISELAPDFIDGFEKYDLISGPVLRGKKKESMDRYKDMAKRFNEGDITFEELRKNTHISNEDFDQWCFKSKKAFEYVNAHLTKRHIVKREYSICEVIDF